MANKKIKNQDIAYAFLDQKEFKKNVIFCTGWDTFFKYKDGYYEMYEPEKFRELIWRFIVKEFNDLPIMASLVKDVMQQIKWAAYRKVKEINTPYIAFNDKLYNIEKFQWEEFDRQKISLHNIPFDSKNIENPIPKFENFLASAIVNKNGETDTDLIKVIQEMFGYYLINNLKAEKVFFLVGRGANGKGVVSRVLEALIGHKYISAMNIQHLTTNQFATANLVGMKVNICSEEESKFLHSGMFKALISGDTIQAMRKFEGGFSFKPTTKYFFTTNDMPSFQGLNHGIRRRMVIIPMNKTLDERNQNKNLSDELITEELSGIVGWAIQGAQRLVENNYKLTETEATDDTKVEFENIVSSPIMFLRENYERNEDGFVENMKMYKEYQTWCLENGKRPMSSVGFHRDISQNLDIKTIKRWNDITKESERGKLVSIKQDLPPEDLERVDKALEEKNMLKEISEEIGW